MVHGTVTATDLTGDPGVRAARLRQTLDGALDAVVAIGTDGRIAGWNREAERCFGWTEAEAIGRSLADTIIPPEQRASHLAGLRRHLETGERSVIGRRIAVEALRRDGTRFPCELTVSAVDAGGEIGFVGFLRDVSERVEAEAALREAEARAREADRLAAVGRFAGGVAHELNNALTVITFGTELLLAGDEPPPDWREAARAILLASERAASFTRQVLAFSRAEPARRELLDLGEALRGLEPLVARLVGEGVRVELSVEPGLPVLADRDHLQQALSSLASNARYALVGGGTLRVEARREGDQALLRIADDGVGMAPEALARAFEPLFTTRPEAAGIGLTTVQAVIEDAGGTVVLASRPGEGTTVTIRLPLAETPATTPVADAVPVSGPTLLVVEDEPLLRRLVCRGLEASGFRVMEAATAQDALDLARSHGDEFDLVVSDVMLPGMTGHRLLDSLRELAPDVPVLLVSGYDDSGARSENGVPGGAFLAKPFTPAALVAKVQEVLAAHGVARASG